MKTHIFYILILLFELSINSYAIDMYIILYDDTMHTVNLDDIQSVCYEDSATLLRINMSNGTNQNYILSEIRKLTFGELVNITKKEIEIVKAFSLLRNYPNPFNPNTTIEYVLAKRTTVSINIYDIQGRFVKNIENGEKVAGSHSIIWNGNDENGNLVSSGVYFYHLKTDFYEETKQMLLLK